CGLGGTNPSLTKSAGIDPGEEKESWLKTSDTIDLRRRMLADWYLAAVARHERLLQSERSRQIVRIGGRSYYVTGECLQNALDAAHQELHLAFRRKRSWGLGVDGRPSRVAVAGLAQ